MAATQKAPTAPARDLSAWLTREQASDILGVSYETIRRWERLGRLHSDKRVSMISGQMVLVYDPQELAKMPHRRREPMPNEQGELCARVFELLDAGYTVREIVIECRETAAKVEDLREQWLDSGGSAIEITPGIKAELERAIGPFATVAELVAKVHERIKAASATGTPVSTGAV